MVSSYFVSVLGRETLETHSQLPKKSNKCSVGAVASFSYVCQHSMSTSSLHRESTDSLIITIVVYFCFKGNRRLVVGLSVAFTSDHQRVECLELDRHSQSVYQ